MGGTRSQNGSQAVAMNKACKEAKKNSDQGGHLAWYRRAKLQNANACKRDSKFEASAGEVEVWTGKVKVGTQGHRAAITAGCMKRFVYYLEHLCASSTMHWHVSE